MSTLAIGPSFARPSARPARSSARASASTRRPTRPAPASAAQLTLRGRIVLVVLFLGLAFALLTVLGGHSAATGAPGQPVPTRTVVVGDGDTLWEIAGTAAAPGEVREMVHRIVELNALPSVALQEGQVLAVPVD